MFLDIRVSLFWFDYFGSIFSAIFINPLETNFYTILRGVYSQNKRINENSNTLKLFLGQVFKFIPISNLTKFGSYLSELCSQTYAHGQT